LSVEFRKRPAVMLSAVTPVRLRSKAERSGTACFGTASVKGNTRKPLLLSGSSVSECACCLSSGLPHAIDLRKARRRRRRALPKQRKSCCGRFTQAALISSKACLVFDPACEGACDCGSEHIIWLKRMEKTCPGMHQNSSKSAALWKSPATRLRTGMSRSCSDAQPNEDRLATRRYPRE
jgi:hypothetical protein